MGDNGVVLFISKHLDTEYCFYDEYMTVNGAPIRYSEMVDIEEVTDGEAAFEFTYGGRRLRLPYDSRFREQITPFFVKAAILEPQISVESEATEQQEPEPPKQQEPEQIVEEPEQIIEEPEQEVYEQILEEASEEEDVEVVTDTAAESEPEAPEQIMEEPLEEPIEEPASTVVVKDVLDPEDPAAENPEEPKKSIGGKLGGVAGKLGEIPKKTLIIAAAVALAIVIAIIAIVAMGGKSIDGLEENVDVKTLETESGDEIKIAVIDENASVEDYALSYYKECFKEGDESQWVINKGTGETVLFVDQGEQVLVCSFDYVEGEEEDLSLLGTGSMKQIWMIYPDKDQLIPI